MKLKLKIRKVDRDISYQNISYLMKFGRKDGDDLILKKNSFLPEKSCYNILYELNERKLYFKGMKVIVFYKRFKSIYEFNCQLDLKGDTSIEIGIEENDVTLKIKNKTQNYKLHPFLAENQKKLLWFYV